MLFGSGGRPFKAAVWLSEANVKGGAGSSVSDSTVSVVAAGPTLSAQQAINWMVAHFGIAKPGEAPCRCQTQSSLLHTRHWRWGKGPPSPCVTTATFAPDAPCLLAPNRLYLDRLCEAEEWGVVRTEWGTHWPGRRPGGPTS